MEPMDVVVVFFGGERCVTRASCHTAGGQASSQSCRSVTCLKQLSIFSHDNFGLFGAVKE